VIYTATDEHGEPVILKEFQLTAGESLDVMIESAKDFETESSILAHLNHPAIVRSLDMFFEKGRVYLVLEHVQGQSLRQLVSQNGPLDLDRILTLTEQMCEILRYLQSQTPPIVHRDFTPDNLILQPNGQLKLIDFSVSQLQEKTSATNCAGKHSYTPPEQFRGEACTQSDIYALGATMYFLATGSDPTPISTSELPAQTDAELQRLNHIIKTATQLDLTNRYESTVWLAVDLREIAARMTFAQA
jgi:serine/threonine-protein kinase